MSYNSLISTAVLDMPLQDDAASTVVVNNAGANGTLVGGDNTADISTTGPTGWLPKALQFDAVADYVTHAEQSFAGEFTQAAWVKNDDTGLSLIFGHNADSNKFTILNATELFVRVLNGGTSVQTNHGVTTTDWNHLAWKRNSSNIVSLWANGVEVNSDVFSGAQAGTSKWSRIGFSVSGSQYMDGAIAGVVQVADDVDITELYAGPEPTYTSGATLSDEGAVNLGTWDTQGNGTITYEWTIRTAGGTEVDSGTLASDTADLTGFEGTTVYLYGRATNDGGYDVGDYATRTASFGSAGDGYYELATVEAAKSITAETGTFTLTGNPTFRKAETGTFTLTGNNNDLRIGHRLAAAVGAFTLAGQTTGLQATRLLQVDPQQYNLRGFGTEFDYNGLNSYHLDSLPGTFSFIGNDILFELTLRNITTPHIATLSKPITVHGINKPITVYTIPVE